MYFSITQIFNAIKIPLRVFENIFSRRWRLPMILYQRISILLTSSTLLPDGRNCDFFNWKVRISLVACFFTFGLASSPAEAQAKWIVEPGLIKDGKVTDTGPPGTQVGVVWSGVRNGVRVDLGRPPPPIQTIGASRFVDFPLPEGGKAKDPLGDLQTITDVTQFTKLPNAAASVLQIAAFVPSGGDFQISPLITYVQNNIAIGKELSIPDLFADTDGNGVLGIGDTLYSTVNLADFLPASVNFNFGDTYSIVNGTSLLLPGMLFGVQPIVPNASNPTGYDNPAPWTGTAMALASHGIVAIPEPGTILLLGIGFIALFRCRQPA